MGIQLNATEPSAKKFREIDSQCKNILAWLKAGNTVTRMSGWSDFGAANTPARICELRHGDYDGNLYNIATEIDKESGHAVYHLEDS